MLNRISIGLVCCIPLLLVSCAQETPKTVAKATQNPPVVEPAPKADSKTVTAETQTTEKADDKAKPAETEPAKPVVPEANDPASESGVMAADGLLMLNAPAGWDKKEASGMFVEIEFSIPKEGDEANDGRMTGMQASGSIEENINRWYLQFIQPDGSSTKDKAVVEELEVSGMNVHKVDISGTYMDGVGPVPKSERADYRMLAAIVEMDGDGKYFLKFYGPKSLVDRHEKGFSEMLQSLKPVQ